MGGEWRVVRYDMSQGALPHEHMQVKLPTFLTTWRSRYALIFACILTAASPYIFMTASSRKATQPIDSAAFAKLRAVLPSYRGECESMVRWR